MDAKMKHILDAAPAAAALVVAIGEAVQGVLLTSPGVTIPFGVLAAVRAIVAVANVIKAPPKG